MDLEQEFKKLVEGMLETVRVKLANGELTKQESSNLETMIEDRMDGWNSSTCYSDSDDSDYTYDDGWSSSMVC